MPEVARTTTPFVIEEQASKIVLGLERIGEHVTQEQAALMLAQVAMETGNGHQCNNNNPGNMTADEHRYAGDYFRPAWFTITALSSPRMMQLNELMNQGKAPRAFRAYSDLQSGFDDHFNQISHTFQSLLVASRTGDAEKFAEAIKSSRYTPDEPAGASHAIAQLQAKYLDAGLFETHPLAADALDLLDSGGDSEPPTQS